MRLHTADFLLDHEVYGGVLPVNGTIYTRLMLATPELGTYNHAPMLSYHNGLFLASWKNSPQDEDQNGQRVLYSQSSDGTNWTSTDGLNILFPNMSSTSNPSVALFAEPAVILNGRQYAAASPIQYCQYPNEYSSIMLLRQVYSCHCTYRC